MQQNAYQALREKSAWIDLTGRGKIRVTGDDRVRLLHAMSTNHVEQLVPGAGCYAFFLSAQGRILADVQIYCLPDYFLLDTEPEVKARVAEHLEKFIIADDVTLHDFTDSTATISVEGPDAMRVLESFGAMPAQTSCSLVDWGHSQIAQWTYTGSHGYAVFVPTENKSDLISRLTAAGVPEADRETADVVRLENGHPRYGLDFSEAQIPQETRQRQAIHFAKGCYLGQEIVERVRSRGHVNKLLCAIKIDSTEPLAGGTAVQSDGRDVGEITSSAWSPSIGKVLALGMIRAEALQASVSLFVNGAQATAKPVGPEGD